jgi:hypothetical protein
MGWIAHELNERYPAPERGYGPFAHLIAENGIVCSKSTAGRMLKSAKAQEAVHAS